MVKSVKKHTGIKRASKKAMKDRYPANSGIITYSATGRKTRYSIKPHDFLKCLFNNPGKCLVVSDLKDVMIAAGHPVSYSSVLNYCRALRLVPRIDRFFDITCKNQTSNIQICVHNDVNVSDKMLDFLSTSLANQYKKLISFYYPDIYKGGATKPVAQPFQSLSEGVALQESHVAVEDIAPVAEKAETIEVTPEEQLASIEQEKVEGAESDAHNVGDLSVIDSSVTIDPEIFERLGKIAGMASVAHLGIVKQGHRITVVIDTVKKD